ncbi:hypothetical protein TSUD_99490 [Trifolium subterraneum]|uniref:Cytochrome P450 n=1 Tax=Trifolium subterraneum TaxID=3900 RepID=A0A2Z6PK09_TRISU|nr:hypothetical protein TSUD_99490 [Trifolium subterraneum]
MATTTTAIILFTVIILTLTWAWRFLNWVWFKPKKLEKLLREQGLKGNSYRFLIGDIKDFVKMQNEATAKPMNLSDDIAPRVYSFVHQSLEKHGKNSFIWLGPVPRLNITDPDLIKDVLNKYYDFRKPNANPLVKLLINGLVNLEGEQWNGSCEMDVWPFLQNMASDVISRTAFGSSYEEGRRIFQLQIEQGELVKTVILKAYIPGWRFLPTPTHRRMKEIARDVNASLTDMITKRECALKAGEATKDDLLGILLESNHKEIKENNNNNNVGMNLEDVIEECKLFYFAGQETTSVLLVWTIVLLSRYPDWQARAREEVFQVFGNNKKPDFDGLSHLKIVTMILYEVLRLYPPVIALSRTSHKDMKLGNLTLPAGVQLFLSIILVQHDIELWGDDAKVFNPERFSEGVLKATNGKNAFFPFGGGPRICIGQNFAILEAKIAIAMILQHFSFELSPTYTHAPTTVVTLQPQYGAHIILRKL